MRGEWRVLHSKHDKFVPSRVANDATDVCLGEGRTAAHARNAMKCSSTKCSVPPKAHEGILELESAEGPYAALDYAPAKHAGDVPLNFESCAPPK